MIKKHRFNCCLIVVASFTAVLLPLFVQAASLEDSLKTVEGTHKDSSKSQQRIDALSEETRALLDKYKKLKHNAEYQDTYNKQLQTLKQEQELLIDSLEKQIADIKITQQRIMPLMHGMVDTLQQFILLDLPFKHEHRLSQVVVLKQQMQSAKLSVPEKFRMVWEAYQTENDYGHSIESYRGQLKAGGEERSVEFLRVGRIALYYLTLDGEESGYWHSEKKSWQQLDDGHNSAIKQALRVADKQQAPILLELPLLSYTTGEGK